LKNHSETEKAVARLIASFIVVEFRLFEGLLKFVFSLIESMAS